MLKKGEILVVDPKGAFFDFKGKEPNYYKYAVYRWDGRFPRFITYVNKIISRNGRTREYRIAS